MHIKKFRHIAIVAENLEKMITFYTQSLGFEEKRRFQVQGDDFRKGVGVVGAEAKGVHLTIPNSTVEIEMFQFTAPLTSSPSPLFPANHPGYRHIALVVDNLQEVYSELKARGISFLSEPIVMKEPREVAGFQFVYLRDPEGNIIELNQLPERA